MKFVDIKEKSIKELHDMLAEDRLELGKLRFRVHDGQLKEVRKIRKIRKHIAQIMTVLNETKA